MRLQTLELENFRQFKDGQIDFSNDADQNVTVIHGQNGSGKTTVLNAFLWVLYEDMESVKRPDRIVNQGEMAAADPGDTRRVVVELTFTHEGSFHRARREHIYRKREENDFVGEQVDEKFILEYEDETGSLAEQKNPDSYIRQIVPRDLAGLFFFDGEYISDLSGIDNQGEIQDAIRQMMGLTIMERSITHLQTVEERFRDELQELASDELSDLIDDQNELEADIEDLERKKEDKQQKKVKYQEEVADINQVLSNLDETRELAEEREDKVEERDEKEAEVKTINDQIETHISKRGFLPFALPAIQKTAADIDVLREEGKIPSELDNGFVEDLLEEGTCICGRPLEDGTEHYHTVESLRSEATADGLEQAAIQYITRLSHVNEEHDEFFDSVESLVQRRKDIKEEIETLSQEIDNIGTKIGDVTGDVDLSGIENDLTDVNFDDRPSPSDLEDARSEKQRQINDLEHDIGGVETQIETKQEQLDELEEEIEAAQEEAHEARVAKHRMQAARDVWERLDKYYQQFQDAVRNRADSRVNETFGKVATKEYEAEITEEFKLRIVDSDHRNPIDVDKSRGERQIASLSFIGSLVDVARQQYEENEDAEYFTGGVYPIVMDSPFGALDSDHRRDVSSILPELADQVVVLVTDTQWDGTVEDAMRDRIGKEYDLDFDESGGPNEMPVTSITELSRTSPTN